MHLSTSAFYKIVFVLSLFMLFFVSSVSYKQLELLNRSEQLMRLSDRINLELEQLLSYVKDAETGQRGYIITHDSSYLQPYLDARVHIRESFRELRYLTKDNPQQLRNTSELSKIVDKRLEMFEGTFAFADTELPVSDTLKKQLKKSSAVMFDIRSQVDKMVALESNLFKSRSKEHKQNVFFTPLSSLFMSIFSLLVFVGSFLKINSDRKKMNRLIGQAADAKVVREGNRIYEELIEGLPAALYTCDNDGYIQLYNKAAVELWGREPLPGRDRWCGAWKVFRPEGSVLQETEFALATVLNEGRVVHNETIIERPDGVRRNVLSHPQPVYDADGRVKGGLNMLIDVTDQRLSQKALEESEIRLRIATEGTKLATWDLDLRTAELVSSPRLVELFGHESSFVMTHARLREQLHPEDRMRIVEKAYDRALETGVYAYEARVIWPDASIRWIKTDGKVMFDEQQQPVRMLGTMLDVTDQREAQDRILKSEKLFKSIALNIPNSLILVFDEHNKILTLEGDIMDKMGYDSRDYEGKNLADVTPPERHAVFVPLYKRVFSGERFSIERKSDDTGDDFMMHFVPLKSDNGEIYAGLIIALDITAFKSAESKLAMLGSIVESSDDAIISKTPEGIVTSWNQSARRIFGYTEEEMIGQPITKIIPEDRLDEEPRILNQLVSGQHVSHFETKRITKDGRIIDISLSLSPLKDSNGVITGVSKIARDITVQKQAEQLLIESEERFRTLVDSAPVLVWMSGLDKLCYFFNKGWLSFTGRTMEQEAGNGWTEGVHPDDLERCMETYTMAFDARKEFYMEYRLRRYDGEYRWISDKAIPRFSADGTFLGYIGGCMDIHDQKNFAAELERQVKERTEQLKLSNDEMKHQKEFAETILDTSIDITMVYDQELRFMTFNKVAERIYGLKKEDILGKELTEVFPEAMNSKGLEYMRKALAGEYIHNTRYLSPVTNLYYEDFMIPLRNGSGEIYAVLIIARDITDAIRNEELLIHLNESLTAKNTELERSNTELASFNHVASHDLQEPLRKIQTFISRIMDKDSSSLSPKGHEYFGKIQASANRMQKLIDDLLTFSRTNKADQQWETIDLSVVLELVQRELAQTIEEKKATIKTGKLPVIMGITFQFHQLFINLIGNALKYSRSDVPPEITIRCEEVDAAAYEFLSASGLRNYYRITVADNGIGFEPQYARQIFDLFQRLHGKLEYSGTGIGLTICKKIVENHHGYIMAEGEPGAGAVFTFFLPR